MRLNHSTPTPARRGRAAFSYIDTAIATAVGSIVMAAVMGLSVFSAKSFAAMGNYMDLDRASRKALDQMSHDIRQTSALQSYRSNQLVFVDYDTNTLTFTYDGSAGTLTKTKLGASTVLLTGCDYLNFDISQRNPIPGVFSFYPATNNAAIGKLVDLSWKCSRKLFGAKLNTESVQTAKIVIRN